MTEQEQRKDSTTDDSRDRRADGGVDWYFEVHERLATLEAELGQIDDKLDTLDEKIDSNSEQVDDHQFVYRLLHIVGAALLALNSGLALYLIQIVI